MARNPDHYAIVIAIDAYSTFPVLRSARKDAADFSKWLVSEEGGGLLPQNIKSITSPDKISGDPLSATPTQIDIDKALIQLGIARGGKIGKRLYFYFAGHGIGPEFDDVGMLMANASMKWPYNVGLRKCRLFFRDSGLFDEIIFFLDCCRERKDDFQTNGLGITLDKSGNPTQVQDFVIMAAAYGEKALEAVTTSTTEPRGVLTKALIEGLTKKAADPLGRVTPASLSAWVIKRVPELTKDPKLAQSPRSDPAQPPNIIFCTIPTSQLDTIRVRITAGAGLNGDLVLFDGTSAEIERRPIGTITAGQPPWEQDLDRNQLYVLRNETPGGPGAKKNLVDLDQAPSPYDVSFP